MLRRHENKDSWKAGALAIAVHAFLLGAMLVSFNWKAAHPVMNVTEVELWDKLPSNKPVIQKQPEIVPPIKEIPVTKPDIKPPEPAPKVEDKPKPVEDNVEIELEKKKEELKQKELKQIEELKQKALAEKQKASNEQRKKEIAQKMRDEDLKDKRLIEQAQSDIEKLKKEFLSEDSQNQNKQANAASAAANASVIGEYQDKIRSKIRGNVNKTLCNDGNPELIFTIGLLPTGELNGTPKLKKSSGNSACDDAVERAISASQPLPLPDDPAIYATFRNLNLKFRPND